MPKVGPQKMRFNYMFQLFHLCNRIPVIHVFFPSYPFLAMLRLQRAVVFLVGKQPWRSTSTQPCSLEMDTSQGDFFKDDLGHAFFMK